MATRQYDIQRAERHFEVTQSVGGAISDAMRVTIDLAVVETKLEAIELLEKVKMHLVEADWPPA